MKKVLVTGATGFIGNYVVNELLRNGYSVIATSSVKEKAILASWFKGVNYIEFDLNNFDDRVNYFQYFSKPDILVHLAWEGLPNYKEIFHIEKNLTQQFSFLNNLIDNGLQDLSVTGTCLEYGMKEGCLQETMEPEPGNPYAIAKNELRKKLQDLQDKRNFNFKWIRLFYMYGKGQNSKALISQLDKALESNDATFNMSGGEQVRDYMPVERVAAYIVEIATQQVVTGIINCCSGNPVTIKQFVLDYIKQRGKTIQLNTGYYPYTDYEPMRFWGDDNKLKSINNNDKMSIIK